MNKWQKPLLQEEEREVPLKVWEVLLYGAVTVAIIVVGLAKLGE